MMKLIFVILFFNFCTCEVQLPLGILNAKDAIEAEGNKKALDNLKKNFESSNGWTSHITGGSLATLGQFPYQALMYMTSDNQNYYICGGSLINFNIVLTAAHCIEPFRYFSVYLGMINRSGRAAFGDENLTKNYSIYHEEYHSEFLWNDIGLLYLPSATESIFNLPCNCIGLVNLPVKDDALIDLIGISATVSGFGKAADDETPSQYLRYANIPIVSEEQCANTFGRFFLNNSIVCASGVNGISSCGGDSGGPWIAKISSRVVQIALVSFGASSGCQLGYPTGHTRITSYLDWIEENINFTTESTTSNGLGTTTNVMTLTFTSSQTEETTSQDFSTTTSEESSIVTTNILETTTTYFDLPSTTSESISTTSNELTTSEATTETFLHSSSETSLLPSTETPFLSTTIIELSSIVSTSEVFNKTTLTTTETHSSTVNASTDEITSTSLGDLTTFEDKSTTNENDDTTTESGSSTTTEIGETTSKSSSTLSERTSSILSTTTDETTSTKIDEITTLDPLSTWNPTTTEVQTTTSENVPLTASKNVKFSFWFGLLVFIIGNLLK